MIHWEMHKIFHRHALSIWSIISNVQLMKYIRHLFSFFIVVKDNRFFIQPPIFYPSGFSICSLFCSGSVQSAILIATIKEGNILLSKCFLNHNDHHCLHHHGHPHNQHDNAQLTGSEQHNPPLYLPGPGSRLPHKLAEGFFILINSYLPCV